MTNLAAAVELVDKWCRESSEWKADKRKQLIPNHFDLGRIKALDQCAAELKTILAELGTGAGGDDMLPDALMPVSKEWYVLCERRFAVDKITISGDLARAIVDAMRNKPSPIETPTYQYVPTQRAGQSTEEYEKSVIDEANRILATRPPVAGLAELTDEQIMAFWQAMNNASKFFCSNNYAPLVNWAASHERAVLTAARAYLAALPKNALLSASPGEVMGNIEARITVKFYSTGRTVAIADAAMDLPEGEYFIVPSSVTDEMIIRAAKALSASAASASEVSEEENWNDDECRENNIREAQIALVAAFGVDR